MKKKHKYFRNSDLIGKCFGRLIVVSRAGSLHRSILFNCKCKCGKTTTVTSSRLRTGNTRSCGCLRHEQIIKLNFKHGGTKTREYAAWHQAKTRCFNPRYHQFEHYGGRGITMCEEWRNSFTTFLSDMGKAPKGDGQHGYLELDRYPNKNGNYEPGNCRWATRTEQIRNRRSTRYLDFNGRTQTVMEWVKERGLNYHTVVSRLYEGWPIEEILRQKKGTHVHGKRKKD